MKQSIFFNMYIIPMIFLTPLLAMSCNSWFSIWMMMELNLMTFIPYIIFTNKYFKEISFKYFIMQSISSSLLIMSTNSITITYENMIWINLMMIFSLLMKLGYPPFHNWFINIMNNMNWMNCWFLSTWQKIIPMIMIMYLFNKFLFMPLILLGSILSSILGLNHQSIRIIFSYSSINHMSWLFMNLMFSEMMWMMYFSIYTLINLTMMMTFNHFNIFFINQMFIFNKFKFYKMIIFLNTMSLSGLPPMMGFKIKWLSIYFLSLNNNFLFNVILILTSMLTFIFYTRMMISFLMIYSSSNKLILKNKFKNNFILLFLMNLTFINLWLMSIWLY